MHNQFNDDLHWPDLTNIYAKEKTGWNGWRENRRLDIFEVYHKLRSAAHVI